MRIKKTQNLDELRERARLVKEEGEILMSKLNSHFKQMQEYYSEWEDRLNSVQEAINKAQEEHGIEVEKITEYDLSQDLALQ